MIFLIHPKRFLIKVWNLIRVFIKTIKLLQME